jgi:hypothetical protein
VTVLRFFDFEVAAFEVVVFADVVVCFADTTFDEEVLASEDFEIACFADDGFFDGTFVEDSEITGFGADIFLDETFAESFLATEPLLCVTFPEADFVGGGIFAGVGFAGVVFVDVAVSFFRFVVSDDCFAPFRAFFLGLSESASGSTVAPQERSTDFFIMADKPGARVTTDGWYRSTSPLS